MPPWKQKAEEIFPELASRFEEADTPYLLWFELRDAFERAYEQLGGTLLFVLMLPIISLLGQAQETNQVADKSGAVQSGAVPVNEATNPDVLRAQQALQVQSGAVLADEATTQFEATKAKAEKGDPQAQYNLGICYDQGQSVAQDHAEAVKLYRKAADEGLAEAQNELGLCYISTGEGIGMARGFIEAVKWFREAANQGYAEAQCNLGRCYFFGRGVSQDFVQAYKWFNLAAAQGNTNANMFLPAIAFRLSPEAVAEAERLSREFAPRKRGEREMPDFTSNGADTAPKASGTGFFITDDGYLISNNHVVKDARKVRLLTSAGLIDAKVVSVDAANDLALLKAEGKFLPLPIAPSRSAQLGGTVATIGFPDIGLQGFAPKLAKGEIASLSGAADDPRYFQISVPVQPGNSGGALVDERGNVIGIVSAKLDASAALAASGALPENVNYAVKSSFLLSFLESVPDVDAKLKAPNTKDEKFEDVVKSAQNAAVLVLVY